MQLAQMDYYEKEVDSLQHRGNLKTTHFLKALKSVWKKGLIRVAGRLKNSLLSKDEQNPIIDPCESRFAQLLISHCHAITLYGGT